MSTVYVKPRGGGRVRMPDRNFAVMDARGAWVPRIDYYERLIITQDLIIAAPPAAGDEAPPPASAPSTDPEPPHMVGSDVSAPSKEK